MLLSHSARVQLQPEVSLVGSAGTGEVSQERKGRGENPAGVGRGTSCPEQCLTGGSEEKVNVSCRLGLSWGPLPQRKRPGIAQRTGNNPGQDKGRGHRFYFVLRRWKDFSFKHVKGDRVEEDLLAVSSEFCLK